MRHILGEFGELHVHTQFKTETCRRNMSNCTPTLERLARYADHKQ